MDVDKTLATRKVKLTPAMERMFERWALQDEIRFKCKVQRIMGNSLNVYVVTTPNGGVVGVYTTKKKAENAIQSIYPDRKIMEDVREGFEGNYYDFGSLAQMWKIELDANVTNC